MPFLFFPKPRWAHWSRTPPNADFRSASSTFAFAQAFAAAEGLTDANMQIYNDFEEITVFGTDEQGNKVEATLPFAKLEKWVK